MGKVTTIYIKEKDLLAWEMASLFAKEQGTSRNALVVELLKRELDAAGYKEDEYELEDGE